VTDTVTVMVFFVAASAFNSSDKVGTEWGQIRVEIKRGYRTKSLTLDLMVRPARFELATYGFVVITPEFPNFLKLG